jgi:2-iminobutanoate/2-iminopropanoate deaminase
MWKNFTSYPPLFASAKPILRFHAEETPEEKTVKKRIQTENAPEPVGPYSQALQAGRFLFVSGQVAIDPEKGRIVANGIREQTARVMENIKAILQTAGYSLSDVVQSNVYLSSMALFSEFNNEYAKYFGKVFPARVTVGIELVQGALLEISVVAYKD